jgi:sugar lactone lactonase YvrE
MPTASRTSATDSKEVQPGPGERLDITFDLLGRLIVCEGDDRRLTRMGLDGKVESLVDNYKGGRFNRPNDVICHSNGCLYFTDPDKRRDRLLIIYSSHAVYFQDIQV